MPLLKLSFITGLREIVLHELAQHTTLHITQEGIDCVYVDLVEDFSEIKSLRSVARAYLVVQDVHYHPDYLSRHKSIVGELIEKVLAPDVSVFGSFKISCAGADSKEVRHIADYIRETYKIVEKEEADLKIHIIKIEDIWEVGVQITPRPLSLREYKVEHMSGAMDPTIAYAMNSLCALEKAKTYLNIFSGSATLLIEAGQGFPNLTTLVGFDNNKEHLSLAIHNITKAGLIQKIVLKEKDIFDAPELGMFDVITSDLPFGMVIGKGEDLEKLYMTFVQYCQKTLHPKGILAVYTHEYALFERIITKSKYKIIKKVELQFTSVVDAYLRPKIFICRMEERG